MKKTRKELTLVPVLLSEYHKEPEPGDIVLYGGEYLIETIEDMNTVLINKDGRVTVPTNVIKSTRYYTPPTGNKYRSTSYWSGFKDSLDLISLVKLS